MPTAKNRRHSTYMILFQEPVNDIHNFYTVVISKCQSFICQNGFGIVVGNILQWCDLAVEGRFRCHSIGNLKVIIAVILFGDKIDFGISDFSDIDIISTA